MKKYLPIACLLTILTACEEVIDVALNQAEPRLVVQANLNVWADGTASSQVRLTTTAPFFNNNIPFVTNAIVTVTDENENTYNFQYQNEGVYTANLTPQPNTKYTLSITYNNETYTATEQLYTTVPLEYVEQRNDGGFNGDEIELKIFFTDPEGKGNYYFFESESDKSDYLDIYEDSFFDGNPIFGLYIDEDLAPGDEITFNLYGVNEQFYNFMFILLQQNGGGGGPFETQPATVRGNIVNQTNPLNFPMGYFRISQVSTLTYTVE